MTDAPLPHPMLADGVVVNDIRERTLVVKPAPDARGLAKYLWSEGHREQVERGGYGGTAPTVWAHGAGHRQIAYGVPGDDGAMRFRFNRGDPNYKQLVSTPGLRATIVVDRGSSHILSVRFHGRRTSAPAKTA